MLSSCLEGGNHLIPITGNGHVDGGGAECPFPKWPLRPRPEKHKDGREALAVLRATSLLRTPAEEVLL